MALPAATIPTNPQSARKPAKKSKAALKQEEAEEQEEEENSVADPDEEETEQTTTALPKERAHLVIVDCDLSPSEKI
jgi:cell division protein FtsN